MWSDLSRLVDVECKNDCSLLKAFFRPEVVNMPQTGLCCWKNRNHVWSDLSRAFFRPEVVNMPQTGLCCWRRTGTMCGVISPG